MGEVITRKWDLQHHISWESTFPAVLGWEEIHLHKIGLIFFPPKSPGLPEGSSVSCPFLNPWLFPNLHLSPNQDIWLWSQDQNSENKGRKEYAPFILVQPPVHPLGLPSLESGVNLATLGLHFLLHQSATGVSQWNPISCFEMQERGPLGGSVS